MKIGLVGGYGHESVALLPDAEFAWACDDYDQRALERAQARGVGRTFPTMEAMLADFHPDVVYVGTVYAHNGRLARCVLEQGFNVVCEKPLASNHGDLAALIRLTQSGQHRIIAEFTMRWNPAFRKVRELIRQGAIGKVAMIQARKTYKFGTTRPDFYKSRELFGGIIGWVAVHAIDYAAWCTGLRYESVAAVQGNRCHPDYAEMEDHAAMLFTMTGGVPCAITADFLRPAGTGSAIDHPLRITGSAGVLEIKNHQVFLRNDAGVQEWSCPPPDYARTRLAIDLVRAATGTSINEISTAECLHITAAALAARDAARNGATECV